MSIFTIIYFIFKHEYALFDATVQNRLDRLTPCKHRLNRLNTKRGVTDCLPFSVYDNTAGRRCSSLGKEIETTRASPRERERCDELTKGLGGDGGSTEGPDGEQRRTAGVDFMERQREAALASKIGQRSLTEVL